MRRFARWPALALTLSLTLPLATGTPGARAQDASTIYRCTSASGEVTIQNGQPCPAGSKQEIRRVEALPSRPPPAIAPAPEPEPVYQPPPLANFVQVAGPADEGIRVERPDLPTASRLADANRLPPPPIYQCETWDRDSYVSEDPAPKPRCVRLDTGGIGQACEMKYDVCARIGDNAACAGWKRRQREVESTWRHARAADRAALQEEFARITTILVDSTCAMSP